MGLFKSLVKGIIKAAEEAKFTPDFSKTEYENWLNFIDKGGTSEEWKALKKQNKWKFKESDIETFEQYQNEIKSIVSKYYELMTRIEQFWSLLYQANNYTGDIAIRVEKMCLQDISYYKKLREIDIKYNKKPETNIPAFKRLAMLYEKQGKFENSVSVCKEAISFGMDEKGRMLRMIRKAGRTPTAEETALIENNI